MALINPPIWLQAGSYPARSDRLAIAALLAYPGFAVDEATPLRIRQGIKPSYQNHQFKVRAAPTPNMTVIVSGGYAFIDQHDAGGSGTYVVVNDGDVTVPVQPAGGAGQYRKDTVVVSVYDAEYAGAVNEARIEVIQGPYAASAGAAVRGTLPPNAQVLADITVGPNQTSVAGGNIFDARNYTAALGGIVPVASNIQPTRPHPGQLFYQPDTDRWVYGDSSGTVKRVLGQWQSYTPSLTGLTIGNGSVVGRYRRQDDHVDVNVVVTWGSTTTGNFPQISVPVAPAVMGGVRWVNAVVINPGAGSWRGGAGYLADNSTTVSTYALTSAAALTSSPSSAGITMSAGGWLSVNISYGVA